MRRITLALIALLAVSTLALAGLSGCGSSTTSSNNNNNTPVNKAEIARADAVILTTVGNAMSNDAVVMLENPALLGFLGGLGIPQLLRSPYDPRAALDAVRAIRTARASKPNATSSSIRIPTGTWRQVGDTLAFSEARPTTYMRIIMPNMSVPTDSDSVTVGGVTYGLLVVGSGTSAETQTVPTALTIRMYNQHPQMGATAGLIATLGYSMTTTAAHVLSQVGVSLTVTGVISTSITFTLDAVNHIYSLAFAINDLRAGVQESLTLALHTDRDLWLDPQNAQITEVDLLSSHTYLSNTWANNLYVTNIYTDPTGSGNDSAHVAGNIKKNSSTVATFVGTLLTPVPPDTCPPITVTVTATGETGSICEILPISGLALHPRRLWTAMHENRPWYRP